jgi:hypothetical protein
MMRDTMYNLHPTSGASDEYCKGLLVGVVGALMAVGMSWDEAISHAAINMPDGARMHCTPESWVDRVMVEYVSSHKVYTGKQT